MPPENRMKIVLEHRNGTNSSAVHAHNNEDSLRNASNFMTRVLIMPRNGWKLLFECLEELENSETSIHVRQSQAGHEHCFRGSETDNIDLSNCLYIILMINLCQKSMQLLSVIPQTYFRL